jgi:hypothetical protein
VNGEEIEELNVKSLQQSISFNLGRQVGDFLKLRTTYDLTWQDYKEDDDTDNRFVLPKDTLVQTAELNGTYTRSGYEVVGEASYSVRNDFEFWGCLPDRNGVINTECDRRALLGQDFNPDAKSFIKYQLGSQGILPPAFQKCASRPPVTAARIWTASASTPSDASAPAFAASGAAACASMTASSSAPRIISTSPASSASRRRSIRRTSTPRGSTPRRPTTRA